MSKEFLLIHEIEDAYIQENFVRLNSFFIKQPFLKGQFKHFTIDFPATVTNLRFPHKLGFQPKDVIQTFLTGTGSLTWNYNLFDANFLDITTSGPCKVRAIIGAYEEQ